MFELYVPSSLPPAHYIERTDGAEAKLRHALLNRADDKPLTLLYGVPGIGKTMLATRVVQGLYDDNHFPDGIFWDKRPATRLEDSLWELLCLLNPAWQGKEPFKDDRLQNNLWRELERRQALLVLDNLTDAQQIHELLFGRAKTISKEMHPIITSRLRTFFEHTFNEGELRDFCDDLGTDYDSLPGSGKKDKSRELIDYHYRRNNIAELIIHYRRVRNDTLLSEFLPGQCRILAISKAPFKKLPLSSHQQELSHFSNDEALDLFARILDTELFGQHRDRLLALAQQLNYHPQVIASRASLVTSGKLSIEDFFNGGVQEHARSKALSSNDSDNQRTMHFSDHPYEMKIYLSEAELRRMWQNFHSITEKIVGG